ncbi:MAG: PQQ-binding-like beta-propeller repeat protein [Planctomycetia bacterium]|nr:MAG: PQQ-binding-like beta-propeller repeat protein [Planctomycetia bacterium]
MPTSRHRSEPRRRSADTGPPRAALALAAIGALAALGLAIWWLIRPRGVDWAAERGIALLESAPPESHAAVLDAWERETGFAWAFRREALRDHLLERIESRGARALLSRVWRVDFADRAVDWRRFRNSLKRTERREQPPLTAGERIRLTPRWEHPAPVGLTAWFSAILPLDGRIFVASLGRAFDDPADDADGVVVVDGASGRSEFFFVPEGRGPRDVVGLVAVSNGLLVAVRNGNVHRISRDGITQWTTSAGSSLISPPLCLPLDRDDQPDIVVMNAAHEVVAINGANGRVLWRRGLLPRGADTSGRPPVYPTLAAGNVWSPTELNVVAATWSGQLAVLNSGGEVRWTATYPTGFAAAATCTPPATEGGPTLYVADRAGRVRSFTRSGREMRVVQEWDADPTGRSGLFASVRTIRSRDPGVAPLLITATGGSATDPRGTLSGLADDGLRWRAPLGGAAWAAPAIADLSGDRRADIVVLSRGPAPEGGEMGLLEIFNADGHVVLAYRITAPADSSAVIADVDGARNGALELLWADRDGHLFCYETGQAGPVEWGVAAGDARGTCNAGWAFSFGQRAFGDQWRWAPE